MEGNRQIPEPMQRFTLTLHARNRGHSTCDQLTGGDSSQQQGQAGTDEDESEGPPALAASDSEDGEGGVDEEDVPKVRSRP